MHCLGPCLLKSSCLWQLRSIDAQSVRVNALWHVPCCALLAHCTNELNVPSNRHFVCIMHVAAHQLHVAASQLHVGIRMHVGVQLKARTPVLSNALGDPQEIFPDNQSHPLLSAHGPVFLATPEAWQRLHFSSFHPVQLIGTDQFRVQPSQKSALLNQIHSWIFVPSYKRSEYSDPRQMRLDWADAVSHGCQYVRIIVIRAEEEEVQVPL